MRGNQQLVVMQGVQFGSELCQPLYRGNCFSGLFRLYAACIISRFGIGTILFCLWRRILHGICVRQRRNVVFCHAQ